MYARVSEGGGGGEGGGSIVSFSENFANVLNI